jgi:hypothetical protein
MAAAFDQIQRLDRADAPEATSLRRLDAFARIMDRAIPIPFTNGATIGLDAVLGLVPIVGDAISTAISCYLIVEAHRLGLPRRKLTRMAVNAGIDGVLGAIPLVGDVFDIVFRANDRNVAIIRTHLETDAKLMTLRADKA